MPDIDFSPMERAVRALAPAWAGGALPTLRTRELVRRVLSDLSRLRTSDPDAFAAVLAECGVDNGVKPQPTTRWTKPMATDPVQVVAEAQHKRCPDDLRWRHPVTDHTASSRAIAAALSAAGALMPEEAQALRQAREDIIETATRNLSFTSQQYLDASRAADGYKAERDALTALLQEVRGVLDLMVAGTRAAISNGTIPSGKGLTDAKALLQKIDQSVPPADPAPSSHGGAGVGEVLA